MLWEKKVRGGASCVSKRKTPLFGLLGEFLWLRCFLFHGIVRDFLTFSGIDWIVVREIQFIETEVYFLLTNFEKSL